MNVIFAVMSGWQVVILFQLACWFLFKQTFVGVLYEAKKKDAWSGLRNVGD